MSRPLDILIIDDNDQKEWSWANLRVTHHSTFEAIASAVAVPARRLADLIILDVDMRRMALPEGLEWATPSLAPFGPTLALPFLRPGRPVAFWPVSNNWGPALMSNGPLVVSMALILSAMEGQAVSLADTQRWLATVDTVAFSPNNPWGGIKRLAGAA